MSAKSSRFLSALNTFHPDKQRTEADVLAQTKTLSGFSTNLWYLVSVPKPQELVVAVYKYDENEEDDEDEEQKTHDIDQHRVLVGARAVIAVNHQQVAQYHR